MVTWMARWEKLVVTLWALVNRGEGVSGGMGGRRGEGRGNGPLFEFFAVGIIFNAADHEIGQMAVFVRDRVEKPIFYFISFLSFFIYIFRSKKKSHLHRR